jgi:hypothetical protein
MIAKARLPCDQRVILAETEADHTLRHWVGDEPGQLASDLRR